MTQQNAPKQEEKIIVYADPEIADLIPGFLENRRKDIKAVNEALREGDLETIRLLGHSMKKGANGSYGFETVTEIGNSLEESAKNNNAEGIQRSMQELAAYLDRVEVLYG
jgi:HPt (histidine-containing phosphotransfer) domain-containing protein